MRKYSFSLPLLLCLALLFTACQKERNETALAGTTDPTTIAGIIEGADNNLASRAASNAQAGTKVQFNMLKYALSYTKLTPVLAREGNYTLFAPSDDAFRAAGFTSYEDLRAVPVETLKAILTYHVLGAEVMAAAVPQATNTELTMLSNQEAYITGTAAGAVYINGAAVVKADIDARNGVIHVIDRVLMPPVGTIVQTAVANPDYSLLVAAVLRASTGSLDVATALSGAGPFTVFAPTNQAFIDLGLATEAAIMSADPETLIPILTYHVIGARVFSSDLVDGAMPTMLSGGTTTINLDGGATIKGAGNTVASRITRTDIVATNGVIHEIDRVLLP
ncbi:MAG TPA: fasciclin domain-containing protein [Chitinophagaceae bacterium]